jgi:hypothetical protein
MSDDEGPAVDDGVDDADIIDLDSDSDLESDEGERSEGSGGEDSEEEDGEEDAGEAGPAASGAARAARRPVGGRPDPLSRESNTPVRVIVVPEGERITSDRVCLTEAAELLAVRAEQIARTGTHFALKLRKEDARDSVDAAEIARAELLERRCPLLLRRVVLVRDPHGNTVVEDWDPNLMSLPDLPRIGGGRAAGSA